MGHDENVRLTSPEGYEIANISYGENATGQYGNSYGYMLIMFKNSVPVSVRGYYNKESRQYIYSEFGNPIDMELDQTNQYVKR